MRLSDLPDRDIGEREKHTEKGTKRKREREQHVSVQLGEIDVDDDDANGTKWVINFVSQIM